MIHPMVHSAFESLADRDIEIGPSLQQKQELFHEFMTHARRIWQNFDFVEPHVGISNDEPPRKVLAAVVHLGDIKARGNFITHRATFYQLLLSERLLGMPKEAVTKVLIHEAVHLGYPDHNQDFRDLVRQHGGAVSETSIESPGVQVQLKQGARFKTVKVFPEDQEQAAILWAKQELTKNRGARYRILQSTQPRVGQRWRTPGGQIYEILEDTGDSFRCDVHDEAGGLTPNSWSFSTQEFNRMIKSLPLILL